MNAEKKNEILKRLNGIRNEINEARLKIQEEISEALDDLSDETEDVDYGEPDCPIILGNTLYEIKENLDTDSLEEAEEELESAIHALGGETDY